MESQITLRLPTDLDRQLSRLAKQRGVKKSQLVREAVGSYLAQERRPTAEEVWRRVSHFAGSVPLDAGALKGDAVARQIRARNVRD